MSRQRRTEDVGLCSVLLASFTASKALDCIFFTVVLNTGSIKYWYYCRKIQSEEHLCFMSECSWHSMDDNDYHGTE